MRGDLLLDTHIAIWLDDGNPSLQQKTLAVIDDCRRNGGILYLSVISAWEIALLVDLKRLVLDVPPDRWVARFLNRPGIESVALMPLTAARSYDPIGLVHRDPADRLLVATAIDLRCPLVTYDRAIQAFAGTHGRSCGFSVAG